MAEPGPPAARAIWWRDDDAGRPHPQLERLLELSRRLAAPLALAVVPGWIDRSTAALIRRYELVTVFQHGVHHANHASGGQRPIELGGGRPPGTLAGELRWGLGRLRELFGPMFTPVMVPPWNRMAAPVEAMLPELGYVAVSARAGGVSPPPGHADRGIPHLDIHVDAMRWRPVRAWRGRAAIAADLAGRGSDAAPGPLGLMTHHLVMADPDFADLEQLLGDLARRGPALADPRALLPA